LSGYALWTTPLAGTRGGRAYGARLNYPNDRWTLRLFAREVLDGYDPAVGFVDRRGYRELSPDVRFLIHPNMPAVKRISWQVTHASIFDLDGRPETRSTDLQFFRIELRSGDFVALHVLPSFERVPHHFEISSGIVLPAGRAYTFLRRSYQVQSATRRPVSVNMTYEDGTFYSGTRRQFAATVSLRPRRGWLVDVSTDLNNVRLAEGRFDTKVWRADLNTQLNPRTSLVNRLQYDTRTRGLGWQSRFRWIERPGNDIYFVYTRNWVVRDRWSVLDQKGSVKVVTTYRF
jgi:hypothetical protein